MIVPVMATRVMCHMANIMPSWHGSFFALLALPTEDAPDIASDNCKIKFCFRKCSHSSQSHWIKITDNNIQWKIYKNWNVYSKKHTWILFYFRSGINWLNTFRHEQKHFYYGDVIMSAMASLITGVSIVCSDVCSGADQRRHQSSASLAFVRGIHRWPVDSPHKGPVMRKMFSFDDEIMYRRHFQMNFIGRKV